MTKISVLGAGLVGFPIALDLSKDAGFQVTLYDIRKERLQRITQKHKLVTVQADLSDESMVREIARKSDLVVSAVPGHLGFQTLKYIIEEGKNVIDIAFFPEDLFELEELAKKNDVIAISDIGVAPGMSNILTAYCSKKLDYAEKARIYVGGLPVARQLPFEYRAPFSPIDVIEEYTRPARFIRDGKLVEMPALTEPELMNFAGIGTLEAFNSDGLRSLIRTIKCPDMIEKTLRYPGHLAKIQLLKDIGMLSTEPVDVKGQQIRPIDLTTQLLFPMWDLKNEEDLTVMMVMVEGTKDGKKMRFTWELSDRFDADTGIHSMARTTGYTATAAVRMVTSGIYTRKGVSPPEYIGFEPQCVEFMLHDLAMHNVIYTETTEILP
ncbi:MAG TPA: saccharopine dehydrogenase C-terminal domain-containing protein [Bacteroidales bacterium]|nr:saccharopine dehydrogenase NADP-binding domain-containing protein [Bacteroidales bacterium]HOX78600.1 saccharopine dehydrogenase C-terminal domain-containing protein [Bacteroidales bacterium]HPI85578.1 saccharopine dehydrogenase C-terminal domain-containing protein [Bacteroidales bacterium]HPM92038.1 saccharopine dehydrogenase C-terminal domain-containing protein [Bacteroidales bacterium]